MKLFDKFVRSAMRVGDYIVRIGDSRLGRVVKWDYGKAYEMGSVGLRVRIKVKPVGVPGRSEHKARWSWQDRWRKATPLEILAAMAKSE